MIFGLTESWADNYIDFRIRLLSNLNKIAEAPTKKYTTYNFLVFLLISFEDWAGMDKSVKIKK